MSAHNLLFFDLKKKKITLNYPKSAAMGFLSTCMDTLILKPNGVIFKTTPTVILLSQFLMFFVSNIQVPV